MSGEISAAKYEIQTLVAQNCVEIDKHFITFAIAVFAI